MKIGRKGLYPTATERSKTYPLRFRLWLPENCRSVSRPAKAQGSVYPSVTTSSLSNMALPNLEIGWINCVGLDLAKARTVPTLGFCISRRARRFSARLLWGLSCDLEMSVNGLLRPDSVRHVVFVHAFQQRFAGQPTIQNDIEAAVDVLECENQGGQVF